MKKEPDYLFWVVITAILAISAIGFVILGRIEILERENANLKILVEDIGRESQVYRIDND